MDKLDQLHIVSDLHLGGAPGHQVFNQGAALAAVINHLSSAASSSRVGLVLNGDIVDFLAADDAAYFDPEGAMRKLEAILADEAFRPIWDALAQFVAAEKSRLALVLGNHDVELALPQVTERVLARICGGDRAARDRVRIAMDGKGYECLVGGRKVLCTHGNQFDPWNPVDFRMLQQVGQAMVAGQQPPPWEPNAGTRLVIDVMNGIKNQYAFVDLLQPETVPVVTLLMALPAAYHTSIFDFAKVMVRRLYDAGRLASGFLSGRPAGDIDGPRALDILTRPELWSDHAARTAPQGGQDWLRQAAEDYGEGLQPLEFVADDTGEMLGFGGLLWDKLRGRDVRENLRDALARYLASDKTFRFDTEDDVYRKTDAAAGDADFVVAGHTHLARRIERKKARGVYFNSGTWIRLIQLSPEMLTPEGFGPVYDALRSGSLDVLDKTRDLILQRRTVVSIWVEGDKVLGELRSALPARDVGAPTADPPWSRHSETLFTCDRLEGAGNPGTAEEASR